MSPVVDNNTVLHDGTTITADVSPVSTTRTNGSAVIDLGKSAIHQVLWALMFLAEDLAESGDTMDVIIEQSASVDSGFDRIAIFPQITSAPTAEKSYSIPFSATKRYLRARIDITDDDAGGDFSVANCQVLVSTFANND